MQELLVKTYITKSGGKSFNVELWQNLVISILSVNQYTIETNYKLLEPFTNEGLVNPNNLIEWDTRTIFLKLIKAGFNKGAFMTNLFANRLKFLGDLAERETIMHCEQVLLSKDKKRIKEFLLPVNGIGNKVINNFFTLSEIDLD